MHAGRRYRSTVRGDSGWIDLRLSGAILTSDPRACFWTFEMRVTNPGGDNGMFSAAFHPQFRDNGEFFVVYGTRSRPKATAVSRFRVSANDRNRADPESEQKLLHILQPWPDHNAACLAFGPDGFLYISLGDGGYSVENGNAQDLSTLLGGILRIDADRHDERRNYGIPDDNPVHWS